METADVLIEVDTELECPSLHFEPDLPKRDGTGRDSGLRCIVDGGLCGWC